MESPQRIPIYLRANIRNHAELNVFRQPIKNFRHIAEIFKHPKQYCGGVNTLPQGWKRLPIEVTDYCSRPPVDYVRRHITTRRVEVSFEFSVACPKLNYPAGVRYKFGGSSGARKPRLLEAALIRPAPVIRSSENGGKFPEQAKVKPFYEWPPIFDSRGL